MEHEEEKITAGQLVDIVDKAFDAFVADMIAAAEKLGHAMLPTFVLAKKQGLGEEDAMLVSARLEERGTASETIVEEALDRIGREYGMEE